MILELIYIIDPKDEQIVRANFPRIERFIKEIIDEAKHSVTVASWSDHQNISIPPPSSR